MRGPASVPLEPLVRRMGESLSHRGPDARDIWLDPLAGIGLAHARLAVVDLSPGGAQPMVSANGRFIIVYNGEVYETDGMRRELEAQGIRFRGHSDTEVIVEACAAWGVPKVLPRLIGMFAFALWDRAERQLTLVRDRFGIKPLYYSDTRRVAFGSELKALMAQTDQAFEIDPEARADYLAYNYVPAPRSIWRGVKKLEPGCMVVFDQDGHARQERWWDLRPLVAGGLVAPRSITPGEAADELDRLLRHTVGLRMVADVPLGAFLSGGIDSSLVVAQMQAQSSTPVKTFTIGMAECGYDESADARAVAHHLGTDHHELMVSPHEALAIIPTLAEFYDEPFADSSQIPTMLVSRLARRHVTVALSGDGGDELFSGYARYLWGAKLWRRLGAIPHPIRRQASNFLRMLPAQFWQGAARLPGAPQMLDVKAGKLADILDLHDGTALYRRLVTCWNSPECLAGTGSTGGPLWDDSLGRDLPAVMERMQYLDATTYLPDDILTKVDRASMAVSLEARVPLLDHRVAAFAFSLPRTLRCDGRTGKLILRDVLARYLPRELFERPKKGFGIPIGVWLRGPLREWAETLLAPSALAANGLRVEPIQQVWRQHLAGPVSRETELWIILMYQAWCQRWAQP